jgi:alkanesulfonate monooxygenase SsuD/methylene tetrahydromethanopterin reductase-like flavin-dependent oxidoreductase (luciferase family)
VKVGISFDLRNPPPWRQDSAQLFGFTLEMCEEAERLGIDSVWVTEHHLFEDGYLPQPLTFAAAVAARTSRVRIGTAVLLAPLHHPVEIAEQAAVVDIVSDGRLDLGLGAGYRVPEFDLYDVDIAGRFETTDERVRQLRELWSSGRLTPPPVQEPVPIYLGYQGPKGARRAGRLGEGLLSLNPALTAPYEEGLAEAGHDRSRGRRAGSLQCWATDDPERDWPVVARHLEYFLNSFRRSMAEGTTRPTPKPVDVERLLDGPVGDPWRSFVYGTPEDVARRVLAYLGDLDLDTIYFNASIAAMPHDVVARAVETIATRLGPLFGSPNRQLTPSTTRQAEEPHVGRR